MRIRKIDFDPPPPPPQPQQQHPAYFDHYDIREYNHSISTIDDDDSDRAFIHVNNNNNHHHHHEHSNRKEEEEEVVVLGEDDDQGDCDAVSITWSNAPGIEVDSPKSYYTDYDDDDDVEVMDDHPQQHPNVNNNNNNNKYGSSDSNEEHDEGVTTCTTNNDTDSTINVDDDDDDEEEEEEEENDEQSSVFLSWPQLPELPANGTSSSSTNTSSLPQHELIKQRCSESVESERPPPLRFLWGRRASDTDVVLTATATATSSSPSCENNGVTRRRTNDEQKNGNNNNNDNTNNSNNNTANMDKQKSTKDDDDCLVPTNQQWWQLGRRRNTFDSYAGGGRKSSAVASNMNNSGRWHIMESFMNGGAEATTSSRSSSTGGARSSSAKSTSTGSDGVNSDSTLVIDNRHNNNNSNKMPLRRVSSRSSAESNNSSFNSSVDGETTPRPRGGRQGLLSRQKSTGSNISYTSSDDGDAKFTKKPNNKRKSAENNKSSITSVVDDEVNDWLFPRRGCQGGSLRNIMPQKSQDDDNGVEVIVDKLKKSSVEISPIDRTLLMDMASSRNSTRWRNKSSISGAADGNNPHYGGMDLGISTLSMQATEHDFGPNSRSRELNDSLWGPRHSESEIYWDSDKISQMKNEGVSLARAKALDEVSSIASSDHSGKLTKRRHLSNRRLSFASSFFGRSSAINEEDDDDDDNCSFQPEKVVPPFKTERMVPRTTSGKLSSMKSSIRPKAMAMSVPPSLLSKARRKSSIDYDDYDDDDEMYSVKNPLAEENLKHEKIVKEANEIMTSVNNSVIAMGMTAPFRPMEEICPSFQKLHKNLGYQMDALNAAIVRTTKSQISKRQGLKKSKSKKSKASIFKSSQYSTVSSGNSLADSSNQGSTMSILNDSEAMSKFILSQMALLQLQQQTGDGASITTNVTPHSFYTSWLPNYMWYQTIAADASSVMRPTSLCSGTGITRDEQYLNPEMLKVFEMFSTYFVGSKHLFQEEDEDDSGANMRRSHWMDTIEEIDSADESSEKSTGSDSELSDESDMVYELGEVGSVNIDQFVDTEKQIEILQTVINDLRKSRLNDRPFVSIEASAPGPASNLSASTSTDERNTSSRDSNLTSSTITNEMNTSGRESNFTSSTSTNEMNGSGRDSNFTSSTLTQDI